VLHVTNGDCAVQNLRDAGMEGDIIAWRDVLHEGPVPAEADEDALRATRARFIAAQGWAAEEEVLRAFEERDARLERAIAEGEDIVLWFETDLYDMLQLVQILDRFPAGAPARLVLVGENGFRGVGELSPDELAPLLPEARTIDAEQVATARAAWEGFRAPDPRALAPLMTATPALPALAPALRRHLEQFPWTPGGINRSERALLQAVADGARSPVDAFLAAQRQEERPFLGDAIAFGYLERMQAGPAPLLESTDLELTPHGHAVLTGQETWAGQPQRQLGGVTLSAGTPEYVWDQSAASIRAMT